MYFVPFPNCRTAGLQVKDFMPGIVVISMDNYNDGSKVVDGNFDGEGSADKDLHWHGCSCCCLQHWCDRLLPGVTTAPVSAQYQHHATCIYR
jgi:hypothetical protein